MSLGPAILQGVDQIAEIYLGLKGKGLSHDQALDLIERVMRVHQETVARLMQAAKVPQA
jgi:hypothetical protein